MPQDTLQTYKHSGKFNPLGLVLALATAAAIGYPLGLAYAYIIRWIPFIYINFFVTLGYGFLFGAATKQILQASKVRNTWLASLCGFSVGLIAIYMEWSGSLHVLFEGSPWFFRPDQMMRGMALLYDQGSWSFHRTAVTGNLLVLVWLIEAGIIVGVATLTPFDFVSNTPFCEKTKCWLNENKEINTLESFTDSAHLAALKAGDIMPITQAKPKAEAANEFTRLLLKRSPKCKIFCTLRVQHVIVTIDTKGNVTTKANDLSSDLIIPASMFDLITQFEEFTPVPAAT